MQNSRPDTDFCILREMMEAYDLVELEIGAGKGNFLIQRAAQLPDTLFIAVEIRAKHAGIMRSRARRRDLKNLIVLQDDIRNVFSLVFQGEGMFDRVFINFPDPWWKKRHERRYLAGENILAEVLRTLKRGGEIFIQTDVFARAGQILALLADQPAVENLDDEGGFVDHNPFGHKSGRELRCEELGIPVFRLHFRKK